MRAEYVSTNCNKTKNLIIAVSFLLRTPVIIAMGVVLCESFDHSPGPVVFSMRRKELMILTGQIIFSVIGEVRVEDDFLISMIVIHPNLGELPLSITFCSETNCIPRLRKMLEGTTFLGCSLRAVEQLHQKDKRKKL